MRRCVVPRFLTANFDNTTTPAIRCYKQFPANMKPSQVVIAQQATAARHQEARCPRAGGHRNSCGAPRVRFPPQNGARTVSRLLYLAGSASQVPEKQRVLRKLAGVAGLEPATPGFGDPCSTKLATL